MLNKVNTEEIPISLKEYCAWYFNASTLYNIFGLSKEMVLPPMHVIATYGTEVEGYENGSLYLLSVEAWKDEDLLQSAALALQLDTSLPDLRTSAKTVCRWIVSRQNLITKNLDSDQRLALISRMKDFSVLHSPFADLTAAFTLQPSSFKEMSNVEKQYYYFFNSLPASELDEDFLTHFKELEIPDEYSEIFDILLHFHADNFSVDEWIEAEASIVELAKIVLHQAT